MLSRQLRGELRPHQLILLGSLLPGLLLPSGIDLPQSALLRRSGTLLSWRHCIPLTRPLRLLFLQLRRLSFDSRFNSTLPSRKLLHGRREAPLSGRLLFVQRFVVTFVRWSVLSRPVLPQRNLISNHHQSLAMDPSGRIVSYVMKLACSNGWPSDFGCNVSCPVQDFCEVQLDLDSCRVRLNRISMEYLNEHFLARRQCNLWDQFWTRRSTQRIW